MRNLCFLNSWLPGLLAFKLSGLPVSPLSRAVTLLISISGQFYMTLLVALLVGKYLGSKKDD